jgi:hypothetical protein
MMAGCFASDFRIGFPAGAGIGNAPILGAGQRHHLHGIFMGMLLNRRCAANQQRNRQQQRTKRSHPDPLPLQNSMPQLLYCKITSFFNCFRQKTTTQEQKQDFQLRRRAYRNVLLSPPISKK